MFNYELTLPEAHPRLHLSMRRILLTEWTEHRARCAAAAQCGSEGPEVWHTTAACTNTTPRPLLEEMRENLNTQMIALENTDTLGHAGIIRLNETKDRYYAVVAELERRKCSSS